MLRPLYFASLAVILLAVPVQADPPEALLPREAGALNEAGFSSLHYAAMRGDAKLAQKLLAAGANVNIEQGTYRGTPLQYAAAAGRVELVRLLVQYDAKIDAADTFGRTPLMWAASKGHKEVVAILLEAGANISATTQSDWTALHYAASEGWLATALFLAQRGAPLEARNSHGKTPAEVGQSKLHARQ